MVTACNNQTKKESEILDKSISKIEFLDFYSTRKCMTCNAIEKKINYTLNTCFSDELKNDKITFSVINVDKEKYF